MKISPAQKGFIIALIAVIAAFGVYFQFLAKKNRYLVDNPTPSTYYFKINNGDEKIISAGQYLEVDLKNGQNSIKVFDQQKKLMYDSAFNVSKNRGLLNITNSDYYVNTQYYGYDLKKDSLLLALPKTNIDGKEYFGAPKHTAKLYNEDFYFNINEKYDRVVKNIQKTESRTKIFRKQDYLNYYKEYYQF